jgi:hypothetical protein
MSVTRLKRKHRKNIARANNETRKIKNLLRTPVLKNVDLDELKSRFTTSAPTEADEKKKPESSVKTEGLLDKVAHAASAAADKVKQVASDAADAVTHSSVVEKATAAASQAVEAVTHTSAYEAVQEAAHNLVEGAKHVLETKNPEENQATEANQTGTEGFDAAEAETKPVNEDGQAGEHPKPEIKL